jgi:hypothetical protein
MKIYIDDYNPYTLSNKLNKLKKYLVNTHQYIEIYSDDGIFYIDDLGIYKIIIIQDETIKYTSIQTNCRFLIDRTKSYKENVTTIPLNHINNTIHKYEYKLDLKSKIKLVIEGTIDPNNNIDQTDHISNNLNNESNIFIPNNFYFEILDKNIDFNELFDNNDLNVFLSLLK